MSWPFIAAIVAAIFAFGTVVGSKYEASEAADTALALYEANQKATQRRLDATDAAAAAHEKDKVRTDALYVDIERMVKDVQTTAFYARGNLCLDAAGLRATSASAPSRRPPASQPATTVRRAAGN